MSDRTDRIATILTFFLSISIYCSSLAPQVTLDFSGIFSTAAFHGGVPHPPGYPLYTLLGHLFIQIVPVSNVAWRLTLFSALTAASACAVLAGLVSKSGGMLLQSLSPTMSLKEAKAARWVSGLSAALIFGFSDGFWSTAVVANPWPLTILFLVVILKLSLTWLLAPVPRAGWLLWVYGLSLSHSQLLFLVAPAMAWLIARRDRRLALRLVVSGCLVIGALWVMSYLPASLASPLQILPRYSLGALAVAVGCMVSAGFLLASGGIWYGGWRKCLLATGCLLGGLALYLYPVWAAHTTPPMNWAYARTVEGWVHLLQRGQYEVILPPSPGRFGRQILEYVWITGSSFHWLGFFAPLLLCRSPCFHEKMRGWLQTWLVFLACLTFPLIALSNLGSDRASAEAGRVLYSLSWVVWGLWLGLGMVACLHLLTQKQGGE